MFGGPECVWVSGMVAVGHVHNKMKLVDLKSKGSWKFPNMSLPSRESTNNGDFANIHLKQPNAIPHRPAGSNCRGLPLRLSSLRPESGQAKCTRIYHEPWGSKRMSYLPHSIHRPVRVLARTSIHPHAISTHQLNNQTTRCILFWLPQSIHIT